MINIKFPDGSVRTYESGVTGYDIAMSISPRLAQDVLAVSVRKIGEDSATKGTTIDLMRPITEDCEIRLLKWEDDEAKRVFWHSSSHLMAEALEALYPGVKFGIGPAVENGFYYDVDFGGMTFTDADLPKIEKKMLELAREKQDFVRKDVSKADAMAYFTEKGAQYKSATGEVSCKEIRIETVTAEKPHADQEGCDVNKGNQQIDDTEDNKDAGTDQKSDD